jgi:ligand-binding sensor domain-containing protein
LLKFNGEEWITDQKKIGVPAAQVFQMIRDNGGNLWFAMETGVVRLSNPYPF